MSGLTCAERPLRRCERVAVHAKKEKQGCGVCGAPPSPLRESGGTRQKRKARLWRVRSAPFAVAKGWRYTPKKKSKVVACAERPLRRCERAAVHVKKGKARLWRVRSGPFAVARERWYTPKKKSKVVACAEHPLSRCERVAVHAKKEKAFDVSYITI